MQTLMQARLAIMSWRALHSKLLRGNLQAVFGGAHWKAKIGGAHFEKLAKRVGKNIVAGIIRHQTLDERRWKQN